MTLKCYRCDRQYRTSWSLHQHIKDSPRHNECPECDFDGETWDELLDHCHEEGCRTVCQGCDNGTGMHWSVNCDEYLEHLDECNVCQTCDRHFRSPSNLYQHLLTHRVADIECLCCYQSFKTYGGMITHIEYGTCSDTSIIDLNQTAAECHMWPFFIDEDYRKDMLDGIDLNSYYSGQVFPYKCPTCGVLLSKLSSLFQHVESSSCSQMLNQGAIRRLQNYLRSQYG